MSQSERRRTLRMGLALPVRVQGFNPDGTSWEEITTTDDVSQGGVSLTLRRSVDLGQVLLLALPLPKRLRQFDLNDASYRVYALVRGMSHRPENARVGVMFFGKFPPRGFHQNPAARYLLPGDNTSGLKAPPSAAAPAAEPPPPPNPSPATRETPATGWAFANPEAAPRAPATPSAAPGPAESPGERRRFPRFEIFVNFMLQQVDEFGAILQEELTVADNMSKGGARVVTTLEFKKGDVVLLQMAGGGFATRAEVREVQKGKDGVCRLHLKFLDRQAPEKLLKG